MLAVVSPVTYIASILGLFGEKPSRPHRLTRFALMIVLSLTALSSYATQGFTSAFLLASVYAVQAIVIFVLSIWYGVGGRSRADFACLLVVALGLGGWRLSGNAFEGLLCFIVADLAAYVPAVRKTRQAPDTETHWTYTLSIFSALCGLLADGLRQTSVFQLYLIGIGCTMVACIKQEWLSQHVPFRFFRAKQPLKQE